MDTPMIHMRLCCYVVNTIFCMLLCLVRNQKHSNLEHFLLFGLYSNYISYVLVLSLKSQKPKTDSVFQILCLPYAYTCTYAYKHALTFTYTYTYTYTYDSNRVIK